MTATQLHPEEPSQPRCATRPRPPRTDGRLIALRRSSLDLPTYPATSAEKAQMLRALCVRHPGCTVHTHQQRLLDAMSVAGQVSVVECRELLNLSNPPQTVRMLNAHGIVVHSADVLYMDREGNLRRTAAYSLGRHD